MWLEVCALLLVIGVWWASRRCTRFQRMVDKFPGPTAYPIVGCALSLGWNSCDLYDTVLSNARKYQWRPHRIWVGPFHATIAISDAKDIEIVLGSRTLVEKGYMYYFLKPWLGDSLVTSKGEKWRRHRKMLTPSFHFKILENFIDVFNANAKILVENMKKKVNGPSFDFYQLATLCSLDVISETSMGFQLNAQNGCGREFVRAIQDQTSIFMKRTIEPWLLPDFLFNLSPTKKIHDRSLEIFSSTANKVIKVRREEMKAKQNGTASYSFEDDSSKRLAFLDLMLIESFAPGSKLTDKDIREEVATFFLGGVETTSVTLSFTLWLLSWHQDIQDKALQEVEEAFSEGNGVLTIGILHEMKYLERVIKECLRVCPSTAFFSREATEEVKLTDGNIVPKGSTIVILSIAAHKNPEYFPDPEKFDPDRFLPENSASRHPYAFIPFSAGPRNCIGQKFAMLEMKSVLAHVLHSFRVLPATETPRLKLAAELTVVAKTGVPIRLAARERTPQAAA